VKYDSTRDNSTMLHYGGTMRHDVAVSPGGISRVWIRRRTIPAEQVRRVHVYVDANGDQGLVVRSALWRFVHVSRTELADPELTAGVRSLIDHVRGRAVVDSDVDRFLASVA
jgi:hypothetical protein